MLTFDIAPLLFRNDAQKSRTRIRRITGTGLPPTHYRYPICSRTSASGIGLALRYVFPYLEDLCDICWLHAFWPSTVHDYALKSSWEFVHIKFLGPLVQIVANIIRKASQDCVMWERCLEFMLHRIKEHKQNKMRSSREALTALNLSAEHQNYA